MDFEELNEHIPYAKYGKAKSLNMSPYLGVTLLMPGRHADESKGGDFCVCVDDLKMNWKRHQFTHTDIFKDVEKKALANAVVNFGSTMGKFMNSYRLVVEGEDPRHHTHLEYDVLPGVDASTFLYATQCLAVAEHRRYSQHEAKFGGRYLPLRFAAGIAEGLWSAADAALRQKKGRPGVEWLEKDYGVPALTKELMS